MSAKRNLTEEQLYVCRWASLSASNTCRIPGTHLALFKVLANTKAAGLDRYCARQGRAISRGSTKCKSVVEGRQKQAELTQCHGACRAAGRFVQGRLVLKDGGWLAISADQVCRGVRPQWPQARSLAIGLDSTCTHSTISTQTIVTPAVPLARYN